MKTVANRVKKISKTIGFSLITTSALLSLASCASYQAAPLTNLSSSMIMTETRSSNREDVTIIAKAFNRADCKRYLDRDVISKGYRPVQLYIENNSPNNYHFSLNRITLPLARAEEVAEKVHTSTAGRAAGYGAAAVFTCGLFAIPAVIDGVKSANANESLDNDFSSKSARDQTLYPHSHANMVLFVPTSGYTSNFDVTLMDLASNKPKTIHVMASE